LKAVIDVGSNSVLTLVADHRSGQWKTVFESSEVTGLGRGTKSSGLLSEQGMSSTLAAVKRGFDKARSLGAGETIAAATMAARIAKNTPEFLERAEAQGTPITVLSGDDEAELGFRAVANDPLFASDDLLSIVDVGGQSTELVTAERSSTGWDVLFRKSYDVGALGLREGLLKDDSPDFRQRLAAVVEIDDKIGRRYLPGKSGRSVTLGATGTNLVTIREKMTVWDADRVHGAYLDYEEVSKAVAWMFELDDAGRAAVPGIEKGREHTLHAGALILERFLFAIGALGCTVSTRGWRHGMLENRQK